MDDFDLKKMLHLVAAMSVFVNGFFWACVWRSVNMHVETNRYVCGDIELWAWKYVEIYMHICGDMEV